jgi:hypothetical protein
VIEHGMSLGSGPCHRQQKRDHYHASAHVLSLLSADSLAKRANPKTQKQR